MYTSIFPIIYYSEVDYFEEKNKNAGENFHYSSGMCLLF